MGESLVRIALQRLVRQRARLRACPVMHEELRADGQRVRLAEGRHRRRGRLRPQGGAEPEELEVVEIPAQGLVEGGQMSQSALLRFGLRHTLPQQGQVVQQITAVGATLAHQEVVRECGGLRVEERDAPAFVVFGRAVIDREQLVQRQHRDLAEELDVPRKHLAELHVRLPHLCGRVELGQPLVQPEGYLPEMHADQQVDVLVIDDVIGVFALHVEAQRDVVEIAARDEDARQRPLRVSGHESVQPGFAADRQDDQRPSRVALDVDDRAEQLPEHLELSRHSARAFLPCVGDDHEIGRAREDPSVGGCGLGGGEGGGGERKRDPRKPHGCPPMRWGLLYASVGRVVRGL